MPTIENCREGLRAALVLLAALLLAPMAAVPGMAQANQARLTSDLNARTGPDNGNPVAFVMPRNATVTVLGCTPDRIWCQVQYGGRTGWAAARFLEGVGNAPIATPDATPAPAPAPAAPIEPLPAPPPPPPPPPQAPPAQPVTATVFDAALARLLGLQPVPVQRPVEPAANEVCFFRSPDFADDFFCIRVGQSDPALAAPWNDAISSIRIGTAAMVQVCSDADYAGWCENYTADIAQLGPRENDAISAFRTVLPNAEGPPPELIPDPEAQVCFYEGIYHSGARICLGAFEAYPFLPSSWNNRVSSIDVPPGLVAELCGGFGFTGECTTFTASVADLGPTRDDTASSLRVTVQFVQ